VEPGDERHVREGLGDEVVCARIQRLGFVELAVLRGQHQDGRPVPLLAEGGAQAVAVDPRQHDVEHDRVVRMLASHPEAIGPICGDVGREPLRVQAPAEALGQMLLVLDDQHAHATTSSREEGFIFPRRAEHVLNETHRCSGLAQGRERDSVRDRGTPDEEEDPR
jgi:hypothetical protein